MTEAKLMRIPFVTDRGNKAGISNAQSKTLLYRDIKLETFEESNFSKPFNNGPLKNHMQLEMCPLEHEWPATYKVEAPLRLSRNFAVFETSIEGRTGCRVCTKGFGLAGV